MNRTKPKATVRLFDNLYNAAFRNSEMDQERDRQINLTV